MAKRKVFGKCRICGEEKQLTQEHYIPRSAGGGTKATLYRGDELLKTLQKDEDGKNYVPRGQIKQNGLVEYSLCKSCNDASGILYDKDFSNFYNGMHQVILAGIKIPKGEPMVDYLEGKVAQLEATIKPMNIAKRILVSFCTVEHESLAERNPEVKKAILDKNYKPNTDNFAIYLSLHVGNSAYYGTIAALKGIGGPEIITQVYAGIESDLLAFYYTADKSTKERGLGNCVDITTWLTDYDYDEEETMKFSLPFNKTLHMRFPVG